MCGGTIEFRQGETVGVCDSCGTKQTLPRLDDDKKANLYDRANHFRRNNEFDKAMGIYEQILNEDGADAEAYWSLVLCRYGIEYVEDPASHKRVPTVNRAQFTSIYMDEDYKSALQYADGYQRQIYEEEAKAIDDIQKGILEISSKEEPFDVFICYKETDNNGRRTQDSVLANDLYHQLVQEGFKVFFARITLEDKLGSAYEPYIFAALNSAKVMVVLGSKPEYFSAVWVKNEWSRYLALVKNSNGKKMLIPAYKDMDPYDLPEEFSHLQAQDMSKLGFMQDLIRGIKKIVNASSEKPAATKETVVINNGNANVAPLLKRAFMFLEDGNFEEADEYCEKVLDQDPENAQAYLGKLLAELEVKTKDKLVNCSTPFDNSNNYQKAVRFGDTALKNELKNCVDYIRKRNEETRLNDTYNKALSIMKSAKTEEDFKSAASIFKTIPKFKDSAELAENCLAQAENSRKNAIYEKAKSFFILRDKIKDYEQAIELFNSISGWKDSDQQIVKCQDRIKELKAEEEKKRAAAEKVAKKAKKIALITTPIVCFAVVFIILLVGIIIPNAKYNSAMELYNEGKYLEAAEAFGNVTYKDSKSKIPECKYKYAMSLYNDEKYLESAEAFGNVDYKDSKTMVLKSKYEYAMSLFNSEKYLEAAEAFANVNYKDSKTMVSECKYNYAMKLYNEEKYIDAAEAFRNIDYKNSDKEALKCFFFAQIETIKNVTYGQTVKFGLYEQDNDTSNGKEEIEWEVLKINDNQILLLSKYALDCKEYNSKYINTTWEECSLRSWLNSAFLNNAFSEEHRKIIISNNVSADKNPKFNTNSGNATNDKVFLLSFTEIEKFFPIAESRKCIPTAYAITQGVYTNSSYTKDGKATCWWWLRSPGYYGNCAGVINSDGSIGYNGSHVSSAREGIRPAIWLDLASLA